MGVGDLDKVQREERIAEVTVLPIAASQGKAGKALFEEFNDGTLQATPIYSLKEFHRVFVEVGDLTEYKAALALTGSWPAWERIKRNWKAFSSILDVWKEEIRVAKTSAALGKINELITEGTDAVALSAAKWIADQQFNKKTEAARSSLQKAKERRALSDAADIPEDDLRRIQSMFDRIENGD